MLFEGSVKKTDVYVGVADHLTVDHRSDADDPMHGGVGRADIEKHLLFIGVLSGSRGSCLFLGVS
jgi:hypothetical protein